MKSLSLAAMEATQPTGKRRLRFGVKLALGVALVGWLLVRGGAQKVAAALAAVHPAWFVLAVGVYLAGQSLCAWKWSLLARTLGFRRPLAYYWVNYLGAMFPSLFLPTSVGGDVFRVLALCRPPAEPASETGDRVSATVSVLADRGTGVLAMGWIASAASLAVPTLRLPALAAEAIYGITLALTVAFLLPFWVRPAFTRRGFFGRVLACWNDPRALLLSVAAAFLFQGLLCVLYVLLGQALRLPAGIAFYCLICPLVSLASMAPITVGGLGVREAALAVLFPLAGMDDHQAIAFGLAWTAVVMISSLLGGGLLFVAERQAGWEGESPPSISELANRR